MRLNRYSRRPAAGLGISFDTSSIASDIVNAIMPAVREQIPGLIDAAWPEIQNRVPGLVDSVMPMVQQRVPQMVDAVIPLVQKQMPALINSVMPMVQTKVFPIIEAEADKLVEKYEAQFLGSTKFLKYVPAVAGAAAAVSLFASGVVLYSWWKGSL